MNCTYYYMYHIQLVLHILLLHLPHTLLLLLPILLLHLLHILLLHILLLHLPHILLLHILLHVLHILHTTCAAVLYLHVFVCFRNRQRMYFAIKHLIEEPQNNFKIFKVRHLDTPTRTRPPDPWCLGCVFYNVCVCVCTREGSVSMATGMKCCLSAPCCRSSGRTSPVETDATRRSCMTSFRSDLLL